MRIASPTLRLLGGFAGLAVLGCGGDDLLLPSAGETAQLRLVSGDLQQAQTGAQLPDPLVVEAVDATGRPVVGSMILFRFVASTEGARVSPDTAQTNGSGRAVAEVRLGEAPGLHPVEAIVVDGPRGLSVRFALTALAPPGGGGGDDDDDGGFGGGGGDDDGGQDGGDGGNDSGGGDSGGGDGGGGDGGGDDGGGSGGSGGDDDDDGNGGGGNDSDGDDDDGDVDGGDGDDDDDDDEDDDDEDDRGKDKGRNKGGKGSGD